MFGLGALTSPGTDSWNVRFQPFLLSRVRLRREFDQCVKRNLHPRTLLLRHIHKVCIDAPENGLVRNNQDVFATLKFHDDRFQADDDVAIRLTAQISIVVLVLIALRKVLRILLFDFSICQTIADTRVKFIQGLPFKLLEGEKSRSLYSSLQSRRPDGQSATIANGFGNETRESVRICIAAFGKVGIASNLTSQIIL